MDTRREFIKKSLLLTGAVGMSKLVPASVQRAFAIDPALGSTYLDAEHIVILMQENRSFDHCFGALRGVRGFNDPRALQLPDKKPVWLQTNAAGDTYAPFRLDIKDTRITWMGSLPHSRASQVDAYNNGKHDQWLKAKRSGNKQYADLPLTLGHYTREDLPFNYAMADAFTVCDQHFCSGMTSTTPNRSFFWTGKITHMMDGIPKAHIRNDDYSYGKLPWQTFPELLQDNGVSWKFYQNDLSCGGGFKGEERSWLANFGCNLLEFFAAYNVKFSARNVASLLKQVQTLPGEITVLQEASPSSEEAAQKNKTSLAKKQEVLDNATEELRKWNRENFEKLSDKEKSLFFNAFVTNTADPSYHSVATLQYDDSGTRREATVPAGDVLYQFRKDVKDGKLPTVSWLAAPQNFSDHPSAPWYGAWYVSEVLDILTQDPEVWKKTIFIVTYDENDGYYDHVPPYSICDENKPGTGKVSAGIDTEIEHVRLENELKQGVPKKQAREAPIGLGFRVPLMIASPWSRGGKVCSQVFDHTSTLQFLETFINKKYNKQVHLENISAWRRAISGDLTSVFSPFNGEKLEKLPFLDRDKFVEDIYNAQFKQEPTGYKKLSREDIDKVIKDPVGAGVVTEQEKGVKPSCAIPYELYADGRRSGDGKALTLTLSAGDGLFGKSAAGAPFIVYAPEAYKDGGPSEVSRAWNFAVRAGDALEYSWPLEAFEHGQYHLRLYGPNGFYRELIGGSNDPAVTVRCEYEKDGAGRATGNIVVKVEGADQEVVITDNAYKKGTRKARKGSTVLDLRDSKGWYDFTVRVSGVQGFERRCAGRVETGKESISDPFMGRIV
ncbi:MAG TPA: phospholipase C, phosphocholine-specific [Puia sp.]|nr:phospholipase C, phosphocholine-specific [Puia sp.]